MNYESFFKNKEILITGGYGFIGSNLCLKLLDLGSKVTVFDNMFTGYGANKFNLPKSHKNLDIIIGDTRDKDSIEKAILSKDIIFNLAGQLGHLESMQDPWNDLSINVESQINLLESCRKFNPYVKIIYTSTRQVYGKPNYLPVDENHPISPVDVNGINKLAAEKYFILYNKLYNINSTILRVTNTYGPRLRIIDGKQTFIGVWLRNAIEKKPIIIFGNGSQIRDLTYIDDLIHIMLLTAMSDKTCGEILNVGGERISLLELAKLFQKIRPNISYDLVEFPENLKSIDIGNYYANDTKLKTVLGWENQVSLLDGLKNCLEYYEANLQHYLEVLS